MKYLLWSVSILAALCLGLLIAPLLAPRPQPVEGALVINQRVYPPQELEETLQSTPYHFSSRDELINDLIYRELLLQEAKQQKIDHEVEFRRAMRDYFEQSMIKTLVDRRSSSEIQPTAAQVAACQPLLGKRYSVRKSSYPTKELAEKDQSARDEEFDLPFLELPEDIRSILTELKGGTPSPVFHSTAGWYRVQLLDIGDLPAEQSPSALEEEDLCLKELKHQRFQQWLETLYQQAHIEIPTGLREGGR